MLKIERHKHCIIVYDEDKTRGIAFPSEESTDVRLYFTELQKCAQNLTPGIVLIPLIFDTQYEVNNRPIKLFLETHDVESVLQKDNTAKELYDFYFAHAIPSVSPASISYIFCK